MMLVKAGVQLAVNLESLANRDDPRHGQCRRLVSRSSPVILARLQSAPFARDAKALRASDLLPLHCTP
jgi:hypothetical protein